MGLMLCETKPHSSRFAGLCGAIPAGLSASGIRNGSDALRQPRLLRHLSLTDYQNLTSLPCSGLSTPSHGAAIAAKRVQGNVGVYGKGESLSSLVIELPPSVAALVP